MMSDTELFALAVLVNGQQLKLAVTNRELQKGHCSPRSEDMMALSARIALENELIQRGVFAAKPKGG